MFTICKCAKGVGMTWTQLLCVLFTSRLVLIQNFFLLFSSLSFFSAMLCFQPLCCLVSFPIECFHVASCAFSLMGLFRWHFWPHRVKTMLHCFVLPLSVVEPRWSYYLSNGGKARQAHVLRASRRPVTTPFFILNKWVCQDWTSVQKSRIKGVYSHLSADGCS